MRASSLRKSFALPKEDKFYREDNTTVEEAIPIRKTKDVMYDIKLVK